MYETVFGRFWAILAAPGLAMDAVREHPRWTAAALAIVLLVGMHTALTLPIAGPEQLDVMQQTRLGQLMSPEDLAAAYEQFENVTFMDRLLSGLQSGFMTLVSIFITSVVYLLFSRVAGGRGTYQQLLGVLFWSSVVSLGLAALVKTPLVLAKGSSMDVSLGPAILAAGNGPLDPVFQFLSLFEVFSLWGLALIVLGLERIHGFARGKAAVVGGGAWLLIVLVMFGLARVMM